jgi:hypothetical protein
LRLRLRGRLRGVPQGVLRLKLRGGPQGALRVRLRGVLGRVLGSGRQGPASGRGGIVLSHQSAFALSRLVGPPPPFLVAGMGMAAGDAMAATRSFWERRRFSGESILPHCARTREARYLGSSSLRETGVSTRHGTCGAARGAQPRAGREGGTAQARRKGAPPVRILPLHARTMSKRLLM